MIADNLQKLGLTGCDIAESESNKGCDVVIDVNTGRLVVLQPDDEMRAYKQSATAEWLKNHLSVMHRKALYSRVIKTEEIKLEDIQQLVMRINDESEGLVDHFLERKEIEPGKELEDFTEHYIKGSDTLTVASKLKCKFNVAEMYILISAVDEKLAEEKILPFVKAVTHQCMMLKDDFLHCNLEEKYFECVNILTARSAQHDPNLIYVKAACITELTTLRDIWLEKGIADKWDKIKEFPKVPVVDQQDKQLQALRREERAIENIKCQHAKILERQEIREQEIIKEIDETTTLSVAIEAPIETAESLDGVGAQAELSEAEMPGSTCSVTSLSQYRESVARPAQHQTVYEKDEAARVTQAAGQYGATFELLAEAASLVIPASASSDANGSVPLESQGAILKKAKKAKLHPVKPAANASHITEITDQASFTERLVKNCEAAHDDCITRQHNLCTYIEHPTDENRKKALEAISRGFWCARYLDVLLVKAGLTMETCPAHNPFFQKHGQLVEADAFKYGISPYFDEARREVPFFVITKDQENNTSFILREGCLPSEAIKACRKQLFLAESYCFFQTIIYDVVLEALGENIFNWYYSRDDSRLRLMSEESHEQHPCINPIETLLMRKPGGRRKLGLIKVWGNIKQEEDCYIDKYNTLHAICVNAKEGQYIVPGDFKFTRDTTITTHLVLRFISESREGVFLPEFPGVQDKNFLVAKKGGVKETSYHCEWSEVMKIKTLYKRSTQIQSRHDKSKRRAHKEEKQHHRETRVKSSLTNAPEQPSLTSISEQSLSMVPQVSTFLLSSYQDGVTDFEADIHKVRSRLTRIVKAYKTNRTDENKERLTSAITELEESVENLRVTSAIDDDTRKSLERQTGAALKKARILIRDKE